MGRSDRVLSWVAIVLGVVAIQCLVVGVAVKPSSAAYLVLLVPALVLVVGGIVLLRRGRRS